MSAKPEVFEQDEISDQEEMSTNAEMSTHSLSELWLRIYEEYPSRISDTIPVDLTWESEPTSDGWGETTIKYTILVEFVYWYADTSYKVNAKIHISHKFEIQNIKLDCCDDHWCQGSRDKTINYWCTDCHGCPYKVNDYDMSEFFLKGGNETKVLTFGDVKSLIDGFEIISLEEIFTLEVRIFQAEKIILDLRERNAKLLALRAELTKEEEELENIHNLYHFDTLEKLEKFLVETHEKQAQALVEVHEKKAQTLLAQVSQKMVELSDLLY